jgi:putative hydrolase of HD superfamily
MEDWNHPRLAKQLAFLAEIDKAKTVLRRTLLLDGSRRENDAEHSWHIAVMAAVLLEHAGEPKPDLLRVLKMLLVHDLVEIDAGDTFAYDSQGLSGKAAKEAAAADRIFGLLPGDQAAAFRGLWQEFEDGATPEAKYAAALDRLQPVVHNYFTRGHSWKKYGIKRSQVLKRLYPIREVSDTLWTFALELLQRAVDRGYLADDSATEGE